MKFQVSLNGTDVNPFEKMGLKANPFPAIPKAEFGAENDVLRNLGAIPIKDTDDLRLRLQGWSNEFIEGCVDRFVPGKIIKFIAEFKET